MKDFFEHLNEIEDTNLLNLLPIEKDYWERQHKWIYDEIGKRLTDKHIVDLGSGCGLMSLYLLYNNIIDTAELWDHREEQAEYSIKLRDKLKLNDRAKIHKLTATPDLIGTNKTIVSIRLGSLSQFESFGIKNKLITVTRIKETHPYLILNKTLPWTEELISYNNFSLNLLQFDFEESMKKFIEILMDERFMESINPLFLKFIHENLNVVVKHQIGHDGVKSWSEKNN